MTTTRAAQAEQYLKSLQDNVYPGRGIIIGQTPDGTRLVQVYWIMGRSENSRNRVFIEEANGFLRTEAKDPAKLTDPSLIIYYPVKHVNGAHIVTNGDQTDTIHAALQQGGSFESALATRTYEPDAPNFTPRISGIVDLKDGQFAYKLSILKSSSNTEDQTLRHTYTYEQALPGFGHCIHTYAGDGNPLPSFQGEPQLVPLVDDAEQIANTYWNALNDENKIALLVKTIRLADGAAELLVVNKE
ncbi:IMP cyclohydrolase [Paenibacillus cremeus]|uniref:Inosine monophosphate cyclohydrolase n=1 Tax=Paenibacillus cremeus TaxID=2163881 RepID=A0A559K4C1_9BACL|nr:IMP cyclohydrolase [Paenibacillus cremeus]TVY06966.1 inosine monophosphate cyclohydrolase [Paenibacillus cremeus]